MGGFLSPGPVPANAFYAEANSPATGSLDPLDYDKFYDATQTEFADSGARDAALAAMGLTYDGAGAFTATARVVLAVSFDFTPVANATYQNTVSIFTSEYVSHRRSVWGDSAAGWGNATDHKPGDDGAHLDAIVFLQVGDVVDIHADIGGGATQCISYGALELIRLL